MKLAISLSREDKLKVANVDHAYIKDLADRLDYFIKDYGDAKIH
jgi:hypothetical protein